MRDFCVWFLVLGLVGGIALPGSAARAADISGAGATFPYPIYAKWAAAYKAETGVGVNYQSIGSGGGIKQIQRRTVDFGATDKPLDATALAKDGLVQFPLIIGGVVPVVNLPGVGPGQLRLTGPVLADLFQGRITKWNDAAIRKLNPKLSLPDKAVSVVHRADGSGTTFILTHYLSEVSPAWKEAVGAETAVAWPVGVGGKGNEGVASYVSRIPGAIGYVEHAYAFQTRLAYALVENRAGKYVKPGREAFAAAAGNADWAAAPGFSLLLTNQPGEASWPITGASFILMHRQPDKPAAAAQALGFFDWAYSRGDAMAEDLDYVPMPDAVVKLVEATWREQIRGASGAVWQGAR